MVNKLKGIIGIVSVVILIYFVASGNTLVAEDAENNGQERFADATISVEASVVVVELEVLEEITGESDIESLNAIPLEKIMQCVREDDGGEMFSNIKLAVRNESSGEVSREERVDEKRKVSDENITENEGRENRVSFRVTPRIINADRIAVSFDFKQIASESTSSSEREAEEQEDRAIQFEVSSEVVLRPGQRRIVSATQKDEAIFLIMSVDI